MLKKDQRLSAKTTKLAVRVMRLSGPVGVKTGGYRALRGNSTESLLSSLLNEIDETVLPRRIKVLTDTNQTAVLHVANRRLFRVAVLGGQVEVNSTPPVSAAEIMSQLLAFFTDATKAVVHSKRSDGDLTKTDSGYAISALVDATSTDLADPDKSDPIPAFRDSLANHAVAWVTLDSVGRLDARDGDPALCRSLENLVRSGLTDIDTQMVQSLAAPDQPGCILLSTDRNDGFILLYARSQSSGFLATLPASQLPLIQPAWVALFG